MLAAPIQTGGEDRLLPSFPPGTGGAFKNPEISPAWFDLTAQGLAGFDAGFAGVGLSAWPPSSSGLSTVGIEPVLTEMAARPGDLPRLAACRRRAGCFVSPEVRLNDRGRFGGRASWRCSFDRPDRDLRLPHNMPTPQAASITP
jgi:hypothetical protein